VSENLAPKLTSTDVLAGRTAVISGGSRGIGLEITRTLARAGANIALIAKDRVARAVAQTVEHFGGIDLCVNDASPARLDLAGGRP
jgi:citronellol/citronellal dehydrogenase